MTTGRDTGGVLPPWYVRQNAAGERLTVTYLGDTPGENFKEPRYAIKAKAPQRGAHA